MVYTKKAVDTPDAGSAWPKETFATEGYQRHTQGGPTMLAAGIRTLLRDANGTVHMWGRQVFEENPGDDTVLWRHFWGKPGQPGGAWQDTASRVLVTDHQPDDFQGFAESGGEQEGIDWLVEEGSSLYFLWRLVGGPVFIHRVDVAPPYPDSTELNSENARQLTPSGVNAHDMQLLRTDDGTWHLIWAAKPDSSSPDQIWHKYVTSSADAFDATSETPDTPDEWSVPSMVTVDFASGPKDSQRGWFVASQDTTWITFTARDAQNTNEAWARTGFPIRSDSVLTGKQVWEGLVSLDADFYVAPDCTLEIKPGTMVVAADSTDRLAGGMDPNLVELIVQGTLLANGTANEPIEFRGVDTTATNGWYGIRMDLIGTTWTGYGYVGSEEPLSSISNATVRDAARGVSIENLIAPNLADVTFKNIGGSPAKHIYLDSTDVVLPYGVWDRTGPDSTHHVDPSPGIWELDGPTNVIAADSVRAGADMGYGTPGRVDLIVSGKLFTAGSTASGDTVYFRPQTQTSAATGWGGILLDQSVYGGSVIEYADIGYAWNPLYVFFPDSLTTVRHSRMHHFAGIGVWVDGSLGQGGIVESNTIIRGTISPGSAGDTGVFVDQAAALQVLDNEIDIFGVQGSSVTSAAIEAYFGNSWCSTAPSNTATLRIAGNHMIGPGVTTAGTYSGVKANWVCGTDERTIEVVKNYIQDFGFAGMEFLQTEDVRADSNNVVSSYRGVEVSRDSTVVGPAVSFKANWLEVRLQAGKEVARTDNKAKTKLGNGAAGRGHNGLMVLDQSVKFIRNEDPDTSTSVKLDARDCYWYLVDSQGNEDFLSLSSEQATKIYPRLVPDPSGGENHFQISPIQTSDTTPTYFKMSGPPQVGRIVAGPGSAPAEDGLGTRTDHIPDRTSLSAPFANPMRGEAEMILALAPENAGPFRVEIFEVTGRRVAVPLDRILVPGYHRIQWNGTDASGQRVAAGAYFVRAEGPSFRVTKKLVLVR
jgi:hypothetical protein